MFAGVVITDIVVTQLILLLFTLITSACGFIIRSLLRRQKAVEAGVCALLRDAILDKHEKYTRQGHCPVDAKTNVEHLYLSYKGLGGNGVIKHMAGEIRKLPTKKEDDS